MLEPRILVSSQHQHYHLVLIGIRRETISHGLKHPLHIKCAPQKAHRCKVKIQIGWSRQEPPLVVALHLPPVHICWRIGFLESLLHKGYLQHLTELAIGL